MKRILLISQHFPPEIGAASNRLQHLVHHFVEQGVQLRIITPHPNYPNPALYRNQATPKHMIDGVRVYRTPVIRGGRFITDKWIRLLNQCLFVLCALFLSVYICVRHRISICLTTSPPIFVNLVGLFLRVIFRRKWIMEVRDLWPDSMVAVGALRPEQWLFKFLKWLEWRFYRAANKVVVVTPRTRQHLMHAGLDEHKVDLVTNGIPDWISKREDATGHADGSNELDRSSSRPFQVLYVGNIGLSQNLGLLLEVAREFATEPISFVFVGEGLDKPKLEARAKDWGLTNVVFTGGVTDRNEIIRWYAQADLGIVSLRESALFQSVLPSKLFEYAAMDVPMVMIGGGEAGELIESYGLGQTVKAEKNAIAAHIRERLNAAPDSIDARAARLRDEFRQTYSWSTLIKQYVTVLNEMTNSGQATPAKPLSVCMVVWNTFETDARVMKEATSIKNEHHAHVTVVAVHEPARTAQHEERDGVRIRRVHRLHPFVAKAVINIRFFIEAYRQRADVYHAHDLNTLVPTYFAARLRRAALIYDAHEVSTDRAGWKLKRFWRFVERFFIRRTDAVITTNETRARFFAETYGIRLPWIIRNVPPYEHITASERLREACGITDNRPIILYQGGMQRERGLERIIDCVPLVPNAHFVFMGNGRLKSELIARVQREQLTDRVHFLDAVPNDVLLTYTASATVGLQLLQNTCLNHYSACSNKLHEYIMAGIPVVASDLPEMRAVIHETNTGLLVDPEDVQQVASAMQRLLQDNALYEQFASNTRIGARRYQWKYEEEKLAQLYARICTGNVEASHNV